MAKYELPRPGDPDWDAENQDSSYFCSECKKPTVHNEQYDAYYCEECNRWEEPACEDPNCEFCAGRPATPKEVKQ